MFIASYGATEGGGPPPLHPLTGGTLVSKSNNFVNLTHANGISR